MKSKSTKSIGVRAAALFLTAVFLFAAAAFPAAAEGTSVTLNALYGKIENYDGGHGLRTYFIVGFSTAADTLVKAVKNDLYRIDLTVTDAGTQQSATFEYHSRSSDEVYDTDSWDFIRVPVCEYGVYPQVGHTYTLSFEVYDGQTRLYYGSSAAGAFSSTNDDFLRNGPIVPDTSSVTVDPNSPLREKTILFAGDSITEAVCETRIPAQVYIAGWPGRVAAANGMYYMNTGLSGATISDKNGTNTVLNQLQKVADRHFDLVILQGGVNDAWFEAPIGSATPDDDFNMEHFDRSTFAGGLEYTFAYAKEHFADAKIGFIVNFSMPSSTEGTTSDMFHQFELAKLISEKWEIPYIDLYNNDELNENRLRSSTRWALGDYVHPNDRGYDILYPYIEQFVKALDAGTDPATLPDPPYTPYAGETIGENETNVALGKRATTSSGSLSATATDGRVDAYTALGDWADDVRSQPYGTSGTCYLEVDLGAVYDLTKVNVVNYVGNLLYKWDAYVTLDKTADISTWTRVGGKTCDDQAYEEGYTISFASTPARYLRIYGMYHTGKAWVLNEVSACGTVNESLTFDGVTVGKEDFVSAKMPNGSATDKLTDGNKTSDPAVTGVIPGGSVTVDLGAVTALSSVVATTAMDNSSYSLWGSADGVDYTYIGLKALGENKEKTFDTNGAYRYLKIQWEDSRRGDRYVALAEVEVYDADGEQLSGLTATAVNAVYSGSNAVDGSKTSYCFINAPKTGFILDLGSIKTLRKLVFYTENGSLPFTVTTSTDGNSFSAYGGYSGGASGACEVTVYGDASARYINILPGGYDANNTFALYEVEAYTVKATDENGNEVDLSQLANIALGKAATAYTASARNGTDYILKNAPGVTDGQATDNWYYGVFGDFYVQIDLGAVYQISAVNVIGYADINHAWSVYGSTDGENFALITSVPLQIHPADGITALFNTTNTRYVRVVADNYPTSGQFSFREVSVYGIDPGTPLDPVISLDKDASVYTASSANGTDYQWKSKPQVADGNLRSDNWTYGVFGNFCAQIDLDAVYNVSAVTVVGYANIRHGWSVYTSEDGADFFYAGGTSSIVHPAEGITLRFTTVAARYVRVYADYYPTNGQFSFREVTVYGTMPVKPLGETSAESVTLPDGTQTALLTDGDLVTVLPVTGALGGYVTNDLGAVSAVTQIDVCTYEGNSGYAVYASSDGTDWVTLGQKIASETLTYNADKGYVKSFACAGSYRYIRVQWTDSARSDGYLTVKEIDIWNGATEYTDVTLTNYSIVYANNNSNDGNYSNYTFYKKPTGFVTLDLGEIKDVRKVAVFAPGGGRGFVVEYSKDGETFNELGRILPDDPYDPAAGYILTADHTSTRYLRIRAAFGSAGNTLNLSEIKVFVPIDALPGDVNGDGEINITDVTALLDYLANSSAVPGGGETAADISGDGIHNISDVTALLDMLSQI